MQPSEEAQRYHSTIARIAAAVFMIAFGELAYGVMVESRFLIRDGFDWIYNVLIYVIAALSFGRGARAERAAGVALGLVLIAAGVVTIVQMWWAWIDPPQIEPFNVTVSAFLIIAVAWLIAILLWPFRHSQHPVIEATWLSARNDVVVSSLYAVVMLAARLYPSLWPQMMVDAISACLCLQAGAKVVRDALRIDAVMQEGRA